jgi:hypothetical protein
VRSVLLRIKSKNPYVDDTAYRAIENAHNEVKIGAKSALP